MSGLIRRWPEHLRGRKSLGRRLVLRRWANLVAGHYGVPVWLCGSALMDHNRHPRDWDIRLRISDDEFAKRFGNPLRWIEEGGTGRWTAVRWRWSAACVKESHSGMDHTGLNVDFQIYPEIHWEHNKYDRYPHFRLDTRRRATREK